MNPVERRERLRRLQRRAAISVVVGIVIAIVGLVTGSRGVVVVGVAFAVLQIALVFIITATVARR